MSNTISNEVVTESAPELESNGQVEEVSDVVENLTEEQIELLPVDEYGDKYVSVSVGGEEVRVPLKEALSGYQRQSDYTRKTQELSEQRRQVQFGAALQEALQSNPKETLELLGKHYGIQQTISPEEELLMDPVEKQFKQLEERVQAFEQARAMQELENTVSTLQSRYGSDFDADEVVARALATGSTDLEAVYKHMKFDSIYEDAQAIRQLRAKKTEETEQPPPFNRCQVPLPKGGGLVICNKLG
jgi:uncharacterized protein YeeX (DUF496 family)